MSRFLKVMIVLLAIAAMAAPAMAEVTLNGYFRVQGTMQSPSDNKYDGKAFSGLFENFETTNNKNLSNRSFVDQRIRLKMTDKLNDNVTVVWYGEYDMPFGDKSARTLSGSGGELSADGIGIETKNAYVDFKVPNSSWSVRTGIQGYGLGSHYEGFVVQDDMNGIKAKGMVGPVALTAGWFKWKENEWDGSDDVDYYSLAGEVKVSDQVKFGLTADLIKNDSATGVNGSAAKTDDYYYGAYGSYTMDNLGFAGSLLFRNSKGQDSGATDGNTWMLNLYVKAALANGNIKLHGIYIPADDSSTGTDRFSANQSGWELHADNLSIFGTDIYYNNGSQGAVNVYSSAYQGYGLMGLTVSGDYKLPEASYLKYGAGYFMAADENPGGLTTAKSDADLGLEVATQIGKKFAEKYDVSIRGSYAFMGDFYGNNVDDLYKVVTMLNVSF